MMIIQFTVGPYTAATTDEVIIWKDITGVISVVFLSNLLMTNEFMMIRSNWANF